MSDLAKLGFYFGTSGAHAGRSLMLDDLRTLFSVVAAEAPNAAYVQAVLHDNVLHKATANNRDHAARRLRQLYGLDASIALFRAFRRLFEQDHVSQGVLAALMAQARDAVFRASVDFILLAPAGSTVEKADLTAKLDAFSAGRMGANQLRVAAGNLLHSWQLAGYLTSSRERQKPVYGEGAVAFALFLGWLEGVRGSLLLKTKYTALLERTPEELLRLAASAARRGYCELLNAGGVVEVRFPGYLTSVETSYL